MRFRIDLKILIFFAVFYFTNQLNIYLWTMLFGFLHELGHLLMGLCLGLGPERIEITPFGFTLKFKSYKSKNDRKKIKTDILVALAGPITNLLIILFILLFNISFLERDLAVYTNLLLFTFNLIPIYPLDGGRLLISILYLFNKDNIKSEYIVNKVSNLYMVIITMIGSVALYYFKNIAIFVIIIYLWSLIIKENKKILIKRKAWSLIKKI